MIRPLGGGRTTGKRKRTIKKYEFDKVTGTLMRL